MTPSGVYKTKNVRRRPELKRMDFEFFTTFVEGYAVDTEPSSGRDGSRCTSRRHDRPDASARTIPWSWWRQRPWTEQPSGCTWVIRRAEILLQHELSRMQISDDGHDCVRTLKSVVGGWRNVWLKTKRNSGQKQQSFVLTSGWPVESNQQRNQRVVVRPSHTRRVELQSAQRQQLQQAPERHELQQAVQQQLINTVVMQSQIKVSRERGGRYKFKTQENLIRSHDQESILEQSFVEAQFH